MKLGTTAGVLGVLFLTAMAAPAQWGELTISKGAQFDTAPVTLTRAADTPIAGIEAGSYVLRVEYRYQRRVLVSFLQNDRVAAETFGYLKGFPELMHRDNSVLDPAFATTAWSELGFDAGSRIVVASAGDRDILQIVPSGAAASKGSIFIRLEPSRRAAAQRP